MESRGRRETRRRTRYHARHVIKIFLASRFITNLPFSRPQNGDPEDLWDFGTVRSTAHPATIGRTQAYVEPQIWESEEDWPNGSSAQAGQDVSGHALSIANKRDLPPLPPGTPRRFNQGTVRHMPAAENARNQRPIERERSDGSDDYEGAKVDGLRHQMEDARLDDELGDTTLLDSVVLPAIASVKSST